MPGLPTNILFVVLGSEDRAILDFERSWWTLPGAKDQMIEFTLGLTASTYYERLLSLVHQPEAMEYDALTVKRVLSLIVDDPGREVAV